MTDTDGSDIDGDIDRSGLQAAVRAELRHAGKLDDVPAETVAAAKAGFIWRTIDAELAELVADSAEEDDRLAGVRSGGEVRMLTFQSPTLTVEVEAIDLGTRQRLMGQLVPPQVGTIEIRHRGGTVTLAADELGRFSADGIVPGPVSLHCSGLAGANAIITDWVVV